MSAPTDESTLPTSNLIEYVATIVQAYVGNNRASATDVAALVREVHSTRGLDDREASLPPRHRSPQFP